MVKDTISTSDSCFYMLLPTSAQMSRPSNMDTKTKVFLVLDHSLFLTNCLLQSKNNMAYSWGNYFIYVCKLCQHHYFFIEVESFIFAVKAEYKQFQE